MRKTVSIPLSRIVSLVGGHRLTPGADISITELCPLDEPSPTGISFIRDFSKAAIPRTPIGAVLVSKSVAPNLLPSGIEWIAVDNPYAAAVSLIPEFFAQVNGPERVVSSKADIHPSAQLGANVSIGPFVAIGSGVIIGNDVTIYPSVTVYPDAKIGDGCTIHSGAVIREECRIGAGCMISCGAIIGSEGFGYVPDPTRGLRPIPQVGGVLLGSFVDVGANTCIDRGTIGDTRVGDHTKIDNLAQVGHNVRIGSTSILCGCVEIAGSAKIGDRVTLAGGTGVADHVHISDDVRVAARGGVTEDLTERGDYAGYPAIPVGLYRRNQVFVRKLASVIRDLTKRIDGYHS